MRPRQMAHGSPEVPPPSLPSESLPAAALVGSGLTVVQEVDAVSSSSSESYSSLSVTENHFFSLLKSEKDKINLIHHCLGKMNKDEA